MRTFSIQTLGCKVNQYESEQLAALLRSRGLIEVASPGGDLRIVNSCSVTIQAGSKSRQTLRRTADRTGNSKTIATGCWATSNKSQAAALAGVDAVIAHHDDVAAELNQLLDIWESETSLHTTPKPKADEGWIIKAGTSALTLNVINKPRRSETVNEKLVLGTVNLPLLGEHQVNRQRAFLKIQDGCDAHCTYCIIPQLRPSLWSKPIDRVVQEARSLVAAGHFELILTGIFLGAYGHPTTLRRRQTDNENHLAKLIDALCREVPDLGRLRLSSLEPGDLTPQLLEMLKSHPQIVPHFHLPLQSGSNKLLHRMNRQYTRDDFLKMIDTVYAAFDRPAITTDIIVGFPGETDAEFSQTLDIVEKAKFIHIHAFSFSPRPGTAAARWTDDFIHGPIVNQRIDQLKDLAATHSHNFRRSFLGETVELLVEQPNDATQRHGRCERYFDVYFEDPHARAGDRRTVRLDRVTPTRTFGFIN